MVSGGVIPGSTIKARVLKSRKSVIEAQYLETMIHSPMERDLPEHYQVYGGCKWLPIQYSEQLRIKEAQIAECFGQMRSTIEDHRPVFHPIVPSPETEGYRNKLEFSFGKYISAKEEIHDDFRFGFHASGAFDRIIDCTYCVLASERVNELFRKINTLTRESGLPTYDPKTQKGFYRHLVIREVKSTGDIMVIWSMNTLDPDYMAHPERFDTVWQSLRDESNIVSMLLLKNTGKADIVTGDLSTLFGVDWIEDTLLGKKFDLGPKSFFQTNTTGAEVLYSLARSQIRAPGGILLDLYAGTGTMGILFADLFEKVYSVEIVPEASAHANKNATKNKITNFEAIALPVEKFVEDFRAKGGMANTILLDPPRDGMHPSAIPEILAFSAREIIYVSCNPSTLVRDLQGLCATEMYRITDITPMDMFPHTHHIETVVRLERK